MDNFLFDYSVDALAFLATREQEADGYHRARRSFEWIINRDFERSDLILVRAPVVIRAFRARCGQSLPDLAFFYMKKGDRIKVNAIDFWDNLRSSKN